MVHNFTIRSSEALDVGSLRNHVTLFSHLSFASTMIVWRECAKLMWFFYKPFGFILFQTSKWQWKFKDTPINIYYEEHENERESSDPPKNILMIPTISDVSTVEEWRLVAKDIVQRVGKVNWRATIVDWPGLGYSDRPKMEYNADVMEKFLVDFMNAPNSPLSCSGEYIYCFWPYICESLFSSMFLLQLLFSLASCWQWYTCITM